MRRSVIVAIILMLLAVVLGLHLRVQPANKALVIRRGDEVRVVGGRVGWAPRYLGAGCLVPREEGALAFAQDVVVATAEGEPFTFATSLQYEEPSLVRGLPDGDWCAALHGLVAAGVSDWLRSTDRETLLADPRAAGWDASAQVSATLRRAGLTLRNVAVRPQIPEDVLSTRSVEEVASLTSDTPPVIVIGLDAGDWQYLRFLMDRGAMPRLQGLMMEGTWGVLETETPALSPLLWTTMMTGVSPLEHGVLDFTRFHPASGTKEPITSDERKVPAVWNMATDGGRSVAVLGLWATYPAEPVHGTIVSDRFFTFLFAEDTPPPGVVWPKFREEMARRILAEVDAQVGYDDLRAYLPWLSQAEYGQHETSKNPYDHPVGALRRILMETRLYDRIATELLKSDLPDLSIIYLQGTDTIGHTFAPFVPPKQAEVTQEDYDRYNAVPEKYFREVDALIGRYRDLAAKHGARLAIVSDHGFHWFEDRPTQLSSFAQATAAKWHRREGIYLLWGPGVSPGRQEPAGLRRVGSTLLALAGLPSDPRLEGPPLPGTPASGAGTVDYRPHFEPVKPVLTASGKAAEEEIAKLRALGYIGSGESLTSAAAGGGTRTAGSWNNEGLILRGDGKKEEAIAAFEKAIEVDPNLASALWNLSDSLFARNELDRSDEMLSRAFAHGLPEGRKYLIGRAIGYQRSGEIDRSIRLLESAVQAKPQDPELRMFRGRYRIEAGDCRGALEDFRVAQQIEPRNPTAWASAGLAANCLGDGRAAEAFFRQALALNPNDARLRAMVEGR